MFVLRFAYHNGLIKASRNTGIARGIRRQMSIHKQIRIKNRASTLAALACTIVALGACSSTNSSKSGLFEPFRQDLPQGNYISQEMLAQLRVGMTPEQVRFALGAPLLVNVFQPDRWNYVFRYQHAAGRVDLRRLVIHFKNGKVERFEGDDLPRAEDGSDPFLPGYKGPAKADTAPAK